MIKQRRQCINCAFCCRNQDVFVNHYPIIKSSKWHYKAEPLQQAERELLLKGDWGFIGKEIRAAQEWDQEYVAKQEELEQKSKDALIHPRMLNALSTGENCWTLKQLNMPSKPEAPDHDYLTCYSKQWQEDKKRTRPVTVDFIAKHTCPFFFPYKEMGGMTLDACEKLRKHREDKHRFWVTNWLVIIGIVVTVIAGLWGYFSPYASTGNP